MKTNRNYGKLNNGILEYAPASFTISNGVILNPTEEMYLKRGWYRIQDNPPPADPGCFVKLIGYSADDVSRTISSNYAQQMIPAVKEVRSYSKLKLEIVLFRLNLPQAFDQFLDGTTLENQEGSKIALRRLYDQAQELRSDNEYFEEYYGMAKKALCLEDNAARLILDECEI